MTNDYGNLELQTVLLAAMKDIDKICRENGLKYYLYAGSVLGALNHKGFIPWDDDVDIVMFPDDLKKLIDIIELEYSELYSIKSYNNTENWYSKISKVQVNDTRIDFLEGEGTPISIDISALHAIPDCKLMRYIQRKQIEYINLSLGVLSGEIVPMSWKTKFTIGKNAKRGKDELGKKLDLLMKKYDNRKTKYVGIMCNTLTPNPYTGRSGYENDITKRDDHEKIIEVQFEDSKFMTFANPEVDLERRYGANWSKPYPEEKRVTKHNVKLYHISDNVRKRVGL